MITDKVVLITGGIRGIGLAIAESAAAQGAKLAITYRDAAKAHRAEEVRRDLSATGAQVLTLRSDITQETDRAELMQTVADQFGRIDGLVLNAAGGLEPGKGENYAMLVNRDANLALVAEARKHDLLQSGSWVIYLTSTWAHEYEQGGSPDFYLPVASTKFRAEQDLLALAPELAQSQIGMGVVVAPLVSDTGAYTIIKRKFRNRMDEIEGGQTVTPAQVAVATLSFLSQPVTSTSGQIIEVGGEG